jgi:hypothetical protein
VSGLGSQGKVLAVQVDEQVGEHEHHQECYAGEDYDDEKSRLFGRALVNMHGYSDAYVGMDVGAGWHPL